MKILKDIRDALAGNVVIPARPPRPNDNGNDDNGNDDNKIAETDSIDLSWMNNLQLYRQIDPKVFARYDRDKDSFQLLLFDLL